MAAAMSGLLADKVILVTGSTTGIGKAIARQAAAAGARVMIHGLDEDAAKEVSSEIGSSADYVLYDLELPDAGDALVDACVKSFGSLDAVVNNAALTTRSSIENADAEGFDKIMAVNLRAPFLIAKAARKQFLKQGSGGLVINIGSINAYCGQTDLLLYSVTKGGMMTLTRNLADALGPEKIRVIQLNVGWTATENEIELKKKEGLPEGWQYQVPARYAPSGAILSPDDVAHHVIFWLSDQAAPASGVIYDLEQFPVIGRQDNRQDL